MTKWNGITLLVLDSENRPVAEFKWTWHAILFYEGLHITHGHADGLWIRDGYQDGKEMEFSDWYDEQHSPHV